MYKRFLHTAHRIANWLVLPVFLIVAIVAAAIVRVAVPNRTKSPRLVWGSAPVISNSYWSRAMRDAGYKSHTFTTGFYGVINKRADWDIILDERYRFAPHWTRKYLAFVDALFRYDIYFLPFTGFFIGGTPAWSFQSLLFRLAGKKTVLIPYGADSYAYGRIRSVPLIHGLLMSYPNAALQQVFIGKCIDYWCQHADVVIPGIMGPDGFGRWDVLIPSNIFLDVEDWRVWPRTNLKNGVNAVVQIAHAPNHRGFKGTEFVVDAVRQLKDEGLLVQLLLIEKMPNTEVKRCLAHDADILVEQLVCTGHGLNALEGLASGVPVVANLEDNSNLIAFRRWSYFDECPIVSASPETLVDVLRELVTRPKLRMELSQAGRAYVEKYHGLDSAQYLFGAVLDFLQGRRESLINLYHPLLGDRVTRSPKVVHPLVNNRIVET